MEKPAITIENLYKSFGQHEVLSGVNLEIEKGKSLVILGGSGTGKSVLIKTIIGLMQPTSGKIYIDDIDVVNINREQRALMLQKCGFLFQAGALFDSLSVEENITFFAEKLYKLSPSQRSDLATEKLKAVGLNERVLKLFPSELSGGMQKRVALARTICTSPEIIFFDEPTTGLDPIMSNVINELIITAKKKLGATCVTITHDMASARAIADKVAMIYQGKIIWQGTPSELDESDNPVVNQFVQGKTQGPIIIN